MDKIADAILSGGLGILGISWEFSGTLGISWELLGTLGNSWELLGSCGNSCNFLVESLTNKIPVTV
jgi:hypothetical protein